VVSGQLEESLRRDIESYIEGRIGGIKQEISALQSELNEALSRLLDRQAEVQLDGGVASSILEHLRAAHEQGINVAAAESSRAKASSEMAIVKAAIAEIDAQDSQAGILKVLVNRSASFAPRVAFFVIKGEQGIGWRARGFQGSVGDTAVHQLSFPLSADTSIGHAARSRQTWSGSPSSHAENHIILNRLGEQPPARVVTVPLVVRSRSVAVLYADSDGLDSEAINLEALETLVRVAGMAVELLVARSAPAAKPTAEPVEKTPEPSSAAETGYRPTAEYEEAAPVVTEAAAESAPAEVEAPESAYARESTPAEASTQTWEEPVPAGFPPVEVVAEPAPEAATEPALEAAAEPEPEVVSAESAPAPRRRYGADVELPVEVSDEEERRLHNDARRFARLLVSEIKLYNEQKVVEGRSEGDLYPRLREYIDRSREMYDKRVRPEVAQRYDYFHNELVRTLAEGDEAKLGNAYPGATVSA